MAREGDLSGEKRWLEEAKAAFERRFGELDRQPHRGLFDKIEQASIAAGMTYARLRAEAELGKVCDEQCGPQPCPYCQSLCEARNEESQGREVRTRAGPVGLKRRRYYCPSCRKVFFPSGPGARPGH